MFNVYNKVKRAEGIFKGLLIPDALSGEGATHMPSQQHNGGLDGGIGVV